MPTESSTGSSGRRYVVLALKIAVSLILLTLLFSRIDLASFWASARSASPLWLLAALAIYALNIVASTWRWQVLLGAQAVSLKKRTLLASYLVASFFNNFLPSNIGGDVVRIRDTARPLGSKTLATTVVFVDRALGLMGLLLVAAIGATLSARAHGGNATLIVPSWLWALFLLGAAALVPAVVSPSTVGRLLQPLTIVHPEWVDKRISTLTEALGRFREQPGTLLSCFTGALVVQGLLVGFYLAVVHALHMPISLWDLAVIVPISFVIQMVPISVNGFGIREAAFVFYFTHLGLPNQSALLLSLVSTVLIMIFSLSGAAVYVSRSRIPSGT